jgi:hypothetical protein
VALDTGLRKDVGKLSLLFTGIGAIIGSGWLFGALLAAQIAGPAAILSWVVGGIMVMVIGLTYAELGVMFPVSGGIIRFDRVDAVLQPGERSGCAVIRPAQQRAGVVEACRDCISDRRFRPLGVPGV